MRNDIPCPKCEKLLIFSLNKWKYVCVDCKEEHHIDLVDPIPSDSYKARLERLETVRVSSNPHTYFASWMELYSLADELLTFIEHRDQAIVDLLNIKCQPDEDGCDTPLAIGRSKVVELMEMRERAGTK